MKNFDEFILSSLCDLKKEVLTKNPSKFQDSDAQEKKIMTLADYKEQVKQQHSKPQPEKATSESPTLSHQKHATAPNFQNYAQSQNPQSQPFYYNYPMQPQFYNQYGYNPQSPIPIVNNPNMMGNFYNVGMTSSPTLYGTYNQGFIVPVNQNQINLNPLEEKYYQNLYSSMPDRHLSGELPAKIVVDFIKTSNLPKEQLKNFWFSLNKPSNKPDVLVSNNEFFLLLKMIALAQNNIEPNAQNLANQAFQQLPVFHNVEEEDAFENFQVAHEEFGDFEHSSPLFERKKELGGKDLINLDNNSPEKPNLEIQNIETQIIKTYDRYNVFDEILDVKNEPGPMETLKSVSQELIFPDHKNLKNTMLNVPQPDNNTKISDFYNPFSPNFTKKEVSLEKTPPKELNLDNSPIKGEDEFFEFQQNQEFAEFQKPETKVQQNIHNDLMNFQDLQPTNKPQDQKKEDFMEFQEFQTDEKTQNAKKEDFTEFQEFQATSHVQNSKDNDFMEFQGFQSHQGNIAFQNSEFQDFQGTQQKSPNFNSEDLKNHQNSQNANVVSERTNNENNNQLEIIVTKGNVYEIDWPEAETEEIKEENQINPIDIKTNNEENIKENQKNSENLWKAEEKKTEITSSRKDDEFEWVEVQPEIQEEKPHLVTKKTEDLMDFNEEEENEPEPSITTANIQTTTVARLENSNFFDWKESPNKQNLVNSNFTWNNNNEGLAQNNNNNNIKDMLEGNNQNNNNIKDLLEGKDNNNANNEENPPQNDDDEFEWNEAPKKSTHRDLSLPPEQIEPPMIKPNTFLSSQSDSLQANNFKSNIKYDDLDFEWNEAPQISQPKNIEKKSEIEGKTQQITSKYDLQDLFHESQQMNSGMNILDLLSQVESFIPPVKILNLAMFSDSIEEISELAEAMFSLEMYDECQALIEHHKVLLEISSCEVEKKRLIAEEKYEEVIGIRDKAKKLEKKLLPKEIIEDFKTAYEKANGRAFSSNCLDKLMELRLAEKLVEEFKKLIEKTASFSEDVTILKEIKAQKAGFVE